MNTINENTFNDSCRIETNEEDIEHLERQELTINDIEIQEEGLPLTKIGLNINSSNHCIGKLPQTYQLSKRNFEVRDHERNIDLLWNPVQPKRNVMSGLNELQIQQSKD